MSAPRNVLHKMLDDIYARIPEAPPCKEFCNKCCGAVPIHPLEADRLGVKKLVTPIDENLKCKLFKDGKCSVYKNRPFTCRIFNATADQEHSYCCPELRDHGTLSAVDIGRLEEEYFDLLNFLPADEANDFARTVAENVGDILQHDINNGWIHTNPFTGEAVPNFVGHKFNPDGTERQ